MSGAKYVQLTTFRRDGRAVSTPVHIVADGDTAIFRTWNVAGKAKRLRHTRAVEIAPSTFRGRPVGPPILAEAHLLDGEASQRAARMLAAKHPILHGRLIPWYHRRRGWTTQQYRLERPPSARSGPIATASGSLGRASSSVADAGITASSPAGDLRAEAATAR
jgi:PPOX class probable F420-dependent enzyme